MKTKLLILMILVTMMPVGQAYAWGGSSDNTDRLSNGQSSVFSPGYLNAAKQQAYSIINQNSQPKSWWDTLVDKVKDKISDKVEEAANTKVQPEVKKKTSSGAQTPTINTSVYSAQYNVDVGDGSTRLINGIKHHFVGFSVGGYSAGDLQQAILEAHQDGNGIVIVRGDSENGGKLYRGNITLYDGVTMMGGYNETGIRDIATYKSIINGTITADGISSPTEINGFKLLNENSEGTCVFVKNSSNVTIINNDMDSYTGGWKGSAIDVRGSSVVIKNNYIYKESLRAIAINVTNGDDNRQSELTLIGNDMQCWLGFQMKNGKVTSMQNNYRWGDVAYLLGNSTFTSSDDYAEGQALSLGGTNNTLDVMNESAVSNERVIELNDTTMSIIRSSGTGLENSSTPSSSNYWRNISNSNIYGQYNTSPIETFKTSMSNPMNSNLAPSIIRKLLSSEGILKEGA